MSKKLVRQQRISALIQSSKIENQEQLVRLLTKEGIQVTQTTLSRDLAELHVLKGLGYYVINQQANLGYDNEKELEWLFQEKVIALTQALNLVVLHTYPGNAQPVGLALDNSHFPEMVGNISGDDTIFVATVSEKGATMLLKKFKQIMVK